MTHPLPHDDAAHAVVHAHAVALAAFGRLVDTITAEQVERYRTADGEWAELPPHDADPLEYPMPKGVRS